MNDVAHSFALSLKPIDNGVTVYNHSSDYQLHNSPADFASDERCAVFQ
ncbi:TPA: hypothetical protein QIZ74_001222 [Klebsiella oxytoca]|nr:hypothetical protein [Klebsiella oxytoca]